MPTRKRLKAEIDPQWLRFQAVLSRGTAHDSNSVNWRHITLFLGVLVLLVWSHG